MSDENGVGALPECGFKPLDEETLRRVVREELSGAINEFTDEFYASVGRSIVRRALVVLGAVLVYAAYKYGVITFPPNLK